MLSFLNHFRQPCKTATQGLNYVIESLPSEQDVNVTMLCEDSEEYEILNELADECEDLPILGAGSCFLRRDLNRVWLF